MARSPLLQLSDVTVSFGQEGLIDAVSLVIHAGDRLALVGRNGCGKSTLMRVMAGQIEADEGTCVAGPGRVVGYMEQDPDLSAFETLGEFASSDLPPGSEYRVTMAAEGSKFDPDTKVKAA